MSAEWLTVLLYTKQCCRPGLEHVVRSVCHVLRCTSVSVPRSLVQLQESLARVSFSAVPHRGCCDFCPGLFSRLTLISLVRQSRGGLRWALNVSAEV